MFCIKTALYDGEVMVNFNELLFNMTVDLTAGIGNFKLNADINRETADQVEGELGFSQYVKAYRCGENRKELVNAHALSQGGILNICVTSTDNSYVKINKVQTLEVKQGGVTKFEAVKDGEATVDSLVVTDGDDCVYNVCKTKLIVLAVFFNVDLPYDIDVMGSVELALVGLTTNRALEALVNPASASNMKIESLHLNIKLEKSPEDASVALKKYPISLLSFVGFVFALL